LGVFSEDVTAEVGDFDFRYQEKLEMIIRLEHSLVAKGNSYFRDVAEKSPGDEQESY